MVELRGKYLLLVTAVLFLLNVQQPQKFAYTLPAVRYGPAPSIGAVALPLQA